MAILRYSGHRLNPSFLVSSNFGFCGEGIIKIGFLFFCFINALVRTRDSEKFYFNILYAFHILRDKLNIESSGMSPC